MESCDRLQQVRGEGGEGGEPICRRNAEVVEVVPKVMAAVYMFGFVLNMGDNTAKLQNDFRQWSSKEK